MAPKFPNPDPATDSVRDRLNQFVEVAGRAVYPPLAVAPSPTTPGQIWWDISDTVKIRNESNAAWADLLTVLGGQPAGSYLRYDEAQTLTAGEQAQVRTNIGAAKMIAVTPVANANDARYYIDFTTENGEVWRLISGSIVKAASSSADITVLYGFNFIGQTFPMASNGDATAGNIFVMTYNNLAGSTTITARTDSGTQVTSTYRSNWSVFGRIL